MGQRDKKKKKNDQKAEKQLKATNWPSVQQEFMFRNFC